MKFFSPCFYFFAQNNKIFIFRYQKSGGNWRWLLGNNDGHLLIIFDYVESEKFPSFIGAFNVGKEIQVVIEKLQIFLSASHSPTMMRGLWASEIYCHKAAKNITRNYNPRTALFLLLHNILYSIHRVN